MSLETLEAKRVRAQTAHLNAQIAQAELSIEVDRWKEEGHKVADRAVLHREWEFVKAIGTSAATTCSLIVANTIEGLRQKREG